MEAGQVIAVLDPADLEINRLQAQARAAQAKAQVEKAHALVAQAEAQVMREQAQAGKAALDLERSNSLFHKAEGAISRQELDNTQAAYDAANAALAAARSALASANAQTLASTAELGAADASLKEAELQLSYTQIRAPADGRIGKKNIEVGNRVAPGQPIAALVQPDFWLVANFKETQLAKVRPGQPVLFRTDAFPGREFRGQVQSIAPASGSQFALLPPDNATGNFTRIVQRVPVRIAVDYGSVGDVREMLMPGMSAIAEIKVGS
jgi:membrane fusion protein (multidrug efflux system)